MNGEDGPFHHEAETVETNKIKYSEKFKLTGDEQKEIWFLENNETHRIDISKENLFEDSAEHDEIEAKLKGSHEDNMEIQEKKLDSAAVHPPQEEENHETCQILHDLT